MGSHRWLRDLHRPSDTPVVLCIAMLTNIADDADNDGVDDFSYDKGSFEFFDLTAAHTASHQSP